MNELEKVELNENPEVASVEVVDPVKEEKKAKSKRILKRVLNIVFYTFLGLFLAFDIFVLVNKLQMKGGNKPTNFFGNEVRLVLTGSMEGGDEFYNLHPEYGIKRINKKDAIFVQTLPAGATVDYYRATYHIGDVVTYISAFNGGKTITHRIIDIQDNGTNIKYTIRGDNYKNDPTYIPSNPIEGSEVIYSDDVYGNAPVMIGKVTKISPFLGRILWAITQERVLMIFIVVVPCALLAIWEIGKVIFTVYSGKKEKQMEKAAEITNQQINESKKAISERDEELAKLREELERMKQQQAKDAADKEN